MDTNNEYKGWTIRAARQVDYPPFLDYYATATKKINNVIKMANKEGHTYDAALHEIKKWIDNQPN